MSHALFSLLPQHPKNSVKQGYITSSALWRFTKTTNQHFPRYKGVKKPCFGLIKRWFWPTFTRYDKRITPITALPFCYCYRIFTLCPQINSNPNSLISSLQHLQFSKTLPSTMAAIKRRVCLVDGEDNYHLFLHCSFTKELWGRLFMISLDHWVAPRKIGLHWGFSILQSLGLWKSEGAQMVVEMLLCNSLDCLIGWRGIDEYLMIVSFH